MKTKEIKKQTNKALKGLSNYPGDLTELTKELLRGNVHLINDDYRFPRPSEDFLADALKDPDFPNFKKKQILAGCHFFYPFLRNLCLDGSNKINKEAVIRTCRVIDIASPPELYSRTESILRLYILIKPDSPDEETLHALERANMGYADIEKNLKLWRRLTEDQRTAGYAFTTLLKMELFDEVINVILPVMQKHVQCDGWDYPIDLYYWFAQTKRNIAEQKPIDNLK